MKKKLTSILDSLWSSPEKISSFSKVFKLLDLNLTSLTLGSTFLSYGQTELKPHLLEQMVKLIISNKIKTPNFVLTGLQPLLKTVTHDDFKTTLLPPMLKAMLRNPEMVLKSISLILAKVCLDLSQYVTELAKPFGTQLHAKDDETRENAKQCVASLASKCSDSDAILALLKAIFDVLNGSEGKLSVADQKISLLSAAALVADNNVLASNKSTICVKVTEHFVKIFESEVHEGTLVHALDCLQTWFLKSQDRQVPQVFIDWLPKGLALKSITSKVRTAYFSCLFSSLLNASSANKSDDIFKAIVKILENASRQPAQVAMVTEAIHCCACYVKMNPEVIGKLYFGTDIQC